MPVIAVSGFLSSCETVARNSARRYSYSLDAATLAADGLDESVCLPIGGVFRRFICLPLPSFVRRIGCAQFRCDALDTCIRGGKTSLRFWVSLQRLACS